MMTKIFFFLVNRFQFITIFFLKFFNIKYILLTLPEDKEHVGKFCNPKKRLQLPIVVFGGIISAPRRKPRGLVCFIPFFSKELLGKKGKKQGPLILRRIEEIRRKINADLVTFGGRMPTIFFDRQKLEFLPSFIRGTTGTVFCILDTFHAVCKKYQLYEKKIMVFGYKGRIGRPVFKHLENSGFDVIGFDLNDNIKKFQNIQIIINVAKYGDNLLPYFEHLETGVTVLDDCYPFLSQIPPGGRIFKVVSAAPGVKFIPGMGASYLPTELVGCVVGAYVSAVYGQIFEDPQEFDQKARETGIFYPFREIFKDG